MGGLGKGDGARAYVARVGVAACGEQRGHDFIVHVAVDLVVHTAHREMQRCPIPRVLRPHHRRGA